MSLSLPVEDDELDLCFPTRPRSTTTGIALDSLSPAALCHACWDTLDDDDDDDMQQPSTTAERNDPCAPSTAAGDVRGGARGLELDLQAILESETDDPAVAATPVDATISRPSTPPPRSRKPSFGSPRMGGVRWGSMSAPSAAGSTTPALGLAFSPPSSRRSSPPSINPVLSPPLAASGYAPTALEGSEEGEEAPPPHKVVPPPASTSSSSTPTPATADDAAADATSDHSRQRPFSQHTSSSSEDDESISFAFPLPPTSSASSLPSPTGLPSTPPPPSKSLLPADDDSLPIQPSLIPTFPIARRTFVLFPPRMRRSASATHYQHDISSSTSRPPPPFLPPAPPLTSTLPLRTRARQQSESSNSSGGPVSPPLTTTASPTTSIGTSSIASRSSVRSPKASKSQGKDHGGGWTSLLSAFPRSASKTSLGASPSMHGSIRSTASARSEHSDRALLPAASFRQSSASFASSQPMGASFSSDARLPSSSLKATSSHPYAKQSDAHLASGRLSDPPSISHTAQQRRSSNPLRAAGGASPLALVVADGDGDNDGYKCPVCVERVGAEFRIKGEKPDVIPECGHVIHHDCFVHVYGPLPERDRFGDMRKPQSFGVCGVCRKSMKVGDAASAGTSGGGKASKLAMLTGMQSMSAPPPPLLVPSSAGGGSGGLSYLEDSDGDDNDPINPLVSGASSMRSGQSDHVRYEAAAGARIVVPSITVLPEYRNVVRGRPGSKTTVTAAVVFEVPDRVRRDDHGCSSGKERALRGTRSELALRPSPMGSPTAAQGAFAGDQNHHPRAGPSITHTPVDILLIFSLASLSTTTSSTAFKTRVIRSSLSFIMAKMGPRDRLSIVTYESGADGVIRKTPFLAVGRDGDGRRRLLDLVENMGTGGENDRYVVPLHREERSDVVSAVNVALDVLLQRKTRNPISGVALVCDSADAVNRSQMDLVIARAEAAAVPIHSIGFGKAHDPAPLWLISNHTAGDYTFVPEWNDLQESLAGVLGGIMSVAITHVKLHFSALDQNFKFSKVCGPLHAIVPPDGNTIDIELRDLCHGEKKEILIEMELLTPGSSHESQDASGSGGRCDDDRDSRDWASSSDSDRRVSGTGSSSEMQNSFSSRSAGSRSQNRESISASDANHLGDAMFGANAAIEEVPCLELDCSFYDPLCSKSCTRLARPILLQLTLLPHTTGPIAVTPETVVVRRRMELLASDMISRALILISKTRAFDASLNLLEETRGVLKSKIDDLIEQVGRDSMHDYAKSAKRAARDASNRENLSALEAIMLDIGALIECFDEDSWVDFNREQKNFGAQQAMILRSQRAWTPRSEIERLYFTTENAIDLVQQSAAAPRD